MTYQTCDNGVLRDMTKEEIEQYEKDIVKIEEEILETK